MTGAFLLLPQDQEVCFVMTGNVLVFKFSHISIQFEGGLQCLTEAEGQEGNIWDFFYM